MIIRSSAQGIAGLVAIQSDMTLVGEAANGPGGILSFRVLHSGCHARWIYTIPDDGLMRSSRSGVSLPRRASSC